MNNPLVIRLAGVTLPNDMFGKSTAALRNRAATMNPAAFAIFFDKVCSGILEALVNLREFDQSQNWRELKSAPACDFGRSQR